MRRFFIALFTVATLAACGTLQSAYNERAREECDQGARAAARGDCYDRVDQNAREHR